MLEEAGLPVATGNADEEVKKTRPCYYRFQ
jgi:hydroxymethylpyrimidine pyrophosphatase-like HAD family hydrolase